MIIILLKKGTHRRDKYVYTEYTRYRVDAYVQKCIVLLLDRQVYKTVDAKL
ncbi:hypothetical protein [Caloranaerobacter sp. DY30410]|uniref:hypothetical protein n=1 Tax=Caloranaerobacter sp. DY30410 TaxID=3238305 RepID=UPI003CFBE9EA